MSKEKITISLDGLLNAMDDAGLGTNSVAAKLLPAIKSKAEEELKAMMIEALSQPMPWNIIPSVNKEEMRYKLAGMAIQGILAFEGFYNSDTIIAKRCIEAADALIKELEKPKQ